MSSKLEWVSIRRSHRDGIAFVSYTHRSVCSSMYIDEELGLSYKAFAVRVSFDSRISLCPSNVVLSSLRVD